MRTNPAADEAVTTEPDDAGVQQGDPSWVRLFKHDSAPLVALAAMVLIYVAVFGSLTWSQQSNYGTFGYDMGLYDQGIWLLSRFKDPFLTIRGLEMFAHHVNVIAILFVPAYWLGAGPHFLYAVETVWMACGAIPVWLLARDRFGEDWVALGLAAAFLLYPSLEWINWWHFHPDALIITPLIAAYWCSTRGNTKGFIAALAVALACKEDAALAVAVLGLVVWLKHKHRSLGWATTAAGAVWFLICTRLIIPLSNGGRAPFYNSFFPGLGTTLPSIVVNLVIHPTRWLREMLAHSRWTYYAQLLYPVALTALLSPGVLAIGLPQTMVNTLSGDSYTHNIQYHYSSIVVAGVFLAVVEGCARTGYTAAGRRFLAGLVLAASLAGNVAWSPSPLSVKYHSGIWARGDRKHRAINAAIALIPKSGSVSATYDIDDHLTHRALIYEWPNPWITSNWAISDDHPADPSKVDWIVLDLALNGNTSGLYNTLTATEFRVTFSEEGIAVLHRVAPGVPNFHGYKLS